MRGRGAWRARRAPWARTCLKRAEQRRLAVVGAACYDRYALPNAQPTHTHNAAMSAATATTTATTAAATAAAAAAATATAAVATSAGHLRAGRQAEVAREVGARHDEHGLERGRRGERRRVGRGQRRARRARRARKD